MRKITRSGSNTGNIFANKYRYIEGEGLGREYCVKGLYGRLHFKPDSNLEGVPKDILEDLQEYHRYREKMAKKFKRQSKRNKLEKTARVINTD